MACSPLRLFPPASIFDGFNFEHIFETAPTFAMWLYPPLWCPGVCDDHCDDPALTAWAMNLRHSLGAPNTFLNRFLKLVASSRRFVDVSAGVAPKHFFDRFRNRF